VRKNLIINNKPVTKKVLHRKIFINFIVIFFILELLFIPFSAANLTSLDGGTKTTDSGSTTTPVGDLPSEPDTSTTEKDDTSTSSNEETTVIEDTTTDTSSDSSIAKDTSTYTSDNTNTLDDKTYDSSDASYVEEDMLNDLIIYDNTTNLYDKSIYDNLYYAPNERIVPEDEIVSKTENTLGDLTSGIEKVVILETREDIDSVRLTPSTDLENVTVTVIKLRDKPEEIINPLQKNGTIYKYLDIKLIANETFIDEVEIDSLEFEFKVEKTWINENEIDKKTIKLIRYHDGFWQNLSTILYSENETYIYYKSISPGFSTFAVVGSKVIEKNESYGADDLSIPWSIIIAFIMSLTIMLILILFKARYIYLKDESK